MKNQFRKTLISASFTALICAGAFIKIPIGPVPVTLQTMFIIMCGLLFPLSVSFTSVLTYLLIGIIGIPVFTSGGGIAALSGPTGGYLLGLIPATILLSFFRKKNNVIIMSIGALLSQIVIYTSGLIVLGKSLNLSLPATLTAGLIPFIPGDIIKTVCAVIAAHRLREKADSILYTEV